MRVLFSIILVSAFSSAECGVTFEKQPDDHIYTEEGQDRTLIWTYSLTAPHDGNFNVLNFFKKNGTDELVATDIGPVSAYAKKIIVTGQATLTIKNFTKDDVAEYFIVLQFFGPADVPSPKVSLYLKEMAKVYFKLPSVPERQDLLVVVEGGEVKLHCTATGGPPPNITWYKELKGNERIEVRSGNGVIIETDQFSSNFTIAKASFKDNAKYACVAKNYGTESVEAHYLAVPFIYVPKDAKRHFFREINGEVNLTCPAIGFPSPVYKWLHKGKEVKGTSQLLEVSSSGKYTCHGSNMANETVFDFEVVDGLKINCTNVPVISWKSPMLEVKRYVVTYKEDGNDRIMGVLVGNTTELRIVNDDTAGGNMFFNVKVEAITSDGVVSEGTCQNFGPVSSAMGSYRVGIIHLAVPFVFILSMLKFK